MPHLVEAIAENSCSNRQEVFCSGAAPSHTWSAKASFELLGAALDHTATDRPLFFPHLEVVHALLVVAEEGGFTGQVFCMVVLLLSGSIQFAGDLASLTLVKQGLSAIEPAAEGTCAIFFEQMGCSNQMLFGMIPIDYLMAVTKVE